MFFFVFPVRTWMNIHPFESTKFYDIKSISTKWSIGLKAAKNVLKERGIEPDENFGVGRGRGPRWLGDTLNSQYPINSSKTERTNCQNLKKENWKDQLYKK